MFARRLYFKFAAAKGAARHLGQVDQGEDPGIVARKHGSIYARRQSLSRPEQNSEQANDYGIVPQGKDSAKVREAIQTEKREKRREEFGPAKTARRDCRHDETR